MRIVPPTFPDRDFNVTDYGAVGNGVTDCHPAFQKAIAAYGKARILRLRNNYHGFRGGNFPTDFRHINVEDVHINQGSGETISIAGVEGALVYDVFLKNITVDTVEPPVLSLRFVENIVLTNVSIAGNIQPTHPPLLPPEKKEL